MGTGAAPFDTLQVADIGDIATNPYNLLDSVARIEAGYRELLQHDVIPLGLGGDHTVTLPILRAIAAKHGPVGLIHVDAHADINDEMFGEKIAHGTTFRRAQEEGLLAAGRVVQIGLRGSGYAAEDFDWARRQGFRVVPAEECWNRSLQPLMQEVRQQLGGGPVYLSFDIDGIDPAFAPGTGTPEVAGLTSVQALEIVRGCHGLNLVGCDLVEVSSLRHHRQYRLAGANLLFEMLCVLPGVTFRRLPYQAATEQPMTFRLNANTLPLGQIEGATMGLDIFVVFVYIASMLLLGWLGMRRATSREEFLVAGRNLGPGFYMGTMAATVLGRPLPWVRSSWAMCTAFPVSGCVRRWAAASWC
jgi:guanidinobutyrase